MKSFALLDIPSETISCLSFSKKSPDTLMVASWDKTITFYNTSTSTSEAVSRKNLGGPALACCWGEDSDAFSAGFDGRILSHNTRSSDPFKVIGTHDDTVTSLGFQSPRNLLISGSYDGKIKFWDTRSNKPLSATVNAQGPVDSFGIGGNCMAVSTGVQFTHIYDIRQTARILHTYEKNSIYRSRVIKMTSNDALVAEGTLDGKVSIMFLKHRKNNYTFRVSYEEDPVSVHPVNALAFHPEHSTLVTGSSNGLVASWDVEAKEKLSNIRNAGTRGAVSALDYSNKGILAIATGNTYDNEDLQSSGNKSQTSITINTLLPNEVSRMNKD